MADLIAAQTGNFTSASTWHTVDATSLLDSEAGTTLLTTLVQASASFTLPAGTYDGLAVKLSSVAASPSGTLAVRVRNATTTSDDADVTVNVSDLPVSGLGWIFFKFPSPFTANGTDLRVLWLNTSIATQVTCYTNGTTANWSKRFRTTTTQAPASGNHLIISNQFTAAGTSTAVVVTLDNTASTSFGPTVSGGPPEGIVVSGNGTLTLGTASSTAYFLKWKGIFWVCGGGTVNLGSSGGRLNSTSSCTFFMDSATGGDTGIMVDLGGTFNAYGATKDPYALLTSDVAASGTAFTVSTATNWVVGDNLAISSTDQTYNHHDNKTIATITGTSITTASLTNAHKGTAPLTAEVVNLTRNIVLKGSSSTLTGYINTNTTTVLNLSYVEMTLLGVNAGNKYGVVLQMTTGSCLIEYSSVHDNTVAGAYGITTLNGPNTINNFTIDHNVFFNTYYSNFQLWNTLTTSNWSFTNNVGIYAPGAQVFRFLAMKGTITGNYSSGGGNYGFSFEDAIVETTEGTALNISGNTTHSNASNGMIFSGQNIGCTFGSATSWRNTGIGFTIGNGEDNVFNNWTCFGSNGGGLQMAGANNTTTYTFNSLFCCADSTFTQNSAIDVRDNFCGLKFNSCTFDSTSGVYRAAFQTFVNGGKNINVTFNNCIGPAPTSASGVFPNCLWNASYFTPSTWGYRTPYMAFQNFNQTAGDHRFYTTLYYVKSDTVIYHTASPSERVVPGNTGYKAWSGCHRASIASGLTHTVSVWIRRSSSGDAGGFNYAGNAPRLMQKRNDSIGVMADTVLATSSGSVGNWEQLTGTTSAATEDGVIEVYVDCDGTSGAWVNVDDWTVS